MDVKLTGKEFRGMAGAYAAMFVPYDPKGRIDPETIGRIMDYGYANGLNGFYLTGSTGEWFLLTPEERRTVMDAAVKYNRGRGKLIAHVGANSTDEAVELARYAADIGIDWISALAPMLYRTSFEAAYFHYKKITAATDLPFLIYSLAGALVPGRDVRFFDLKNVKGMKYTGRDYYAAQTLKRRLGKETIWFAGCDEQLLCGLALGNVFSGGIGTSYNIIPKHYATICRLAAAGRFREAAAWQDEANRVVELMIESDNWSYRKAMMKFIGIDCGPYPAPFEKLTPAQERSYFARFARLGVVKRNQALEFVTGKPEKGTRRHPIAT